MQNYRKLAVIDIDGTLLDYTSAFRQWCIEHKGLDWVDSNEYSLKTYLPNIICDNEMAGLVKEFAVSHNAMKLQSNPYARAYIGKLREEGWLLGVMSSFVVPEDRIRCESLRWINLQDAFGLVFDFYDFLELGEDKTPLLETYCELYEEVLFVDDNPEVIQRALEIEADNLTVLAWSNSYNEHLEGIGRISIKTFIEEE